MLHLHKDDVKTKLGAGPLNSRWQVFAEFIRAAPDDSLSIEKSFGVATFDPTRIAFRLLREIYLWFGLEEDKIPYVVLRDGQGFVDIDALQRG